MSHSTTNAIPTSRKGAAGYLCGIQQQYMAKKGHVVLLQPL